MIIDPSIRQMTAEDYSAVYALWAASEGIGLSDGDDREGIERYLRRNPGLSFVACDGDRIVGAVLCGHDGRRGFLHHLAVAREARRHGLGRRLAERCLAALQAEGIAKCHLVVFHSNQNAIGFWARTGWVERTDLVLMSHLLPVKDTLP